MYRLLSIAVVAGGLLIAGCDEADYGVDPDGIGVDASNETIVDPADPVVPAEPVAPVTPAPDDDQTDVQIEQNETLQLESDQPAPADATSVETDATSIDASSTDTTASPSADNSVEEVPADALPEEDAAQPQQGNE